MLHSLEIEGSYAHKKRFFEFQPGLTTITGLNGTGKSEILEIIQWLLFGTKALRGESIAKATLHFEVKGNVYSIFRHKSKAVLSDDKGTPIATGTKPVNARILEILSYNYDVFTVANCVNQGKIEELGTMLPTQRKRMVDATIGLDRLDDVSKWLTGEISELNGSIRAEEKYLSIPAHPGPDPVPLHSAEALREMWGDSLRKNTERNSLLDQINAPLVEVELEVDVARLPDLEHAQEQRQQALGAIAALTGVVGTLPERGSLVRPVAHPQAGELEKLEADTREFLRVEEKIEALSKERRALILSSLTEEEIFEMEREWVLYDQIKERNRIRGNRVEVQCPMCDHVFSKEDDRLKIYEGLPEEVERPKHSLEFLLRERKHLPNKEKYEELSKDLTTFFEYLGEFENHTKTIQLIKQGQKLQDQYDKLIASVEQREQLERQIAELQRILPPDNKERIASLKRNQSDYDQYQKAREAKYEALKKLHDYPDSLPEDTLEFERQFNLKSAYSTHKKAYDEAFAIYQAHLAEFDRLLQEKEDYDKARKAITMMRERVKTYLIPSLNKVTSMLLNQFSSGWLNHVHIDDDFEIRINGQPVSTLSGAGKAFANLALRVGLGLVLTNGVFSVLMLDEIDQGVDKEKAPALAEALRSLTGQIKQVIYVSHKSNLESDHAISL